MADAPTRRSGSWTGFLAGALVVIVLVLAWMAWSHLHPANNAASLALSLPRPSELPNPPGLPEGPRLPAAPVPRPK